MLPIIRYARLLLPLLLVLGALPVRAQDVLDNRSVIQLTAAGVDPVVIVSAVEGGRSRFSVGVADLVALSNARVHRDVIVAMQAAARRGGQPKAAAAPARAPAPAAPALPNSFGVFIARGGGYDALPASGTHERGRISTGDTVRVLYVDSTKHFERRLVFGTRPTFTVIVQDPLLARRVRMFSVGGFDNGATLGGEVRLRAGPVGSDPRMVQVTPETALSVGKYVIFPGDSTRGFGFVSVRGSLDPPLMTARTALDRVRRAPAVATRLPPARVMEVVRHFMKYQEIPDPRGFGPDGLLVSGRGVVRGGLFGTDAATQYAVLVQRTASGSVVRIVADTYTSGTAESRSLDARELARTPLVASAARSRASVERLITDIRAAR
jgi:hypothetical protein